MDELLARMRAAVRRTPAADVPPRLRLGDLVIDLAAKRVTRDGAEADSLRSADTRVAGGSEAAGTDGQPDGDIRLTPTEWHLLEVLLRNPGKLLSHRQLLHDVWGPGYDNAGGNLRLYMAQLRRKLEPDPARPRWLVTEPGMGYRYQPPDPGGRAAEA
jgi:two-component system, OmpR family, KDP operon response regulator KdpE